MEFDRFLRREKELERSDLVFPILFIDVDDLADERAWVERPVLRVIAQRQYADWREMRYDPDSVPARRNLALFCSQIARALKRRIAPPREAGGGGPGKAVVGGRRSNEEVDEGGSDRRPAPARTWPPAVTVVAVAALSAGMATLFGYVSFQTGAGEFIAKAQSGPIFALALIVLYRLHGRQDLTASLILTMSVTVSWIAGFQNHFALKGLFGIDVTKDVAVFTLYFIIMGLLGGIGTLAGALAMQPAPSMPMRGRLVPLTAVAVAAALAPGVYAMVLNVNQHLIMLLCYFSWQAAVMLSIFGLRREPLLATLRTSSPL